MFWREETRDERKARLAKWTKTFAWWPVRTVKFNFEKWGHHEEVLLITKYYDRTVWLENVYVSREEYVNYGGGGTECTYSTFIPEISLLDRDLFDMAVNMGYKDYRMESSIRGAP